MVTVQSYSVFLAYYLRSGSFSGGSPLAFAFVGGLSISMGTHACLLPPTFFAPDSEQTALLVSPLATTSIRIWGTRPTLFIGVVLEA